MILTSRSLSYDMFFFDSLFYNSVKRDKQLWLVLLSFALGFLQRRLCEAFPALRGAAAPRGLSGGTHQPSRTHRSHPHAVPRVITAVPPCHERHRERRTRLDVLCTDQRLESQTGHLMKTPFPVVCLLTVLELPQATGRQQLSHCS